MAERVKMSPDLLAVWRLIQEHKTPTQIGNTLGFSRAWANKLIDRLVEIGLVFGAGDIPVGAVVAQEYPWHVVAAAPILPPGATMHVEYVPESQRDLRVRPVTRVTWEGWDIQGVPFLRPDGLRSKERTPDQVLVVVTNLKRVGDEWVFRAPIREGWKPRPWKESDTGFYIPIPPKEHVPKSQRADFWSAMTRNIACVLGVRAVLDLTGSERIE